MTDRDAGFLAWAALNLAYSSACVRSLRPVNTTGKRALAVVHAACALCSVALLLLR